MLDAFIENPRRAPRAPVRCEARVALRDGGFWAGPIRDLGPRGCQLLTPVPLAPGSRLFVELANERVKGPFQLSGRIAWSSRTEPWRSGVAFDDPSGRTSTQLFEQLAEAYPGLDAHKRAPDRIPVDAPLAPAPPPAVHPELLAEEVTVLRAVGAGLTAAALREKLSPRWEASVNNMFALLGRGFLVIGPPDAAAAEAWTPHLDRLDAAPG
jgi:hypothetical protein